MRARPVHGLGAKPQRAPGSAAAYACQGLLQPMHASRLHMPHHQALPSLPTSRFPTSTVPHPGSFATSRLPACPGPRPPSPKLQGLSYTALSHLLPALLCPLCYHQTYHLSTHVLLLPSPSLLSNPCYTAPTPFQACTCPHCCCPLACRREYIHVPFLQFIYVYTGYIQLRYIGGCTLPLAITNYPYTLVPVVGHIVRDWSVLVVV